MRILVNLQITRHNGMTHSSDVAIAVSYNYEHDVVNPMSMRLIGISAHLSL